jgi:hypothetical protein
MSSSFKNVAKTLQLTTHPVIPVRICQYPAARLRDSPIELPLRRFGIKNIWALEINFEPIRFDALEAFAIITEKNVVTL